MRNHSKKPSQPKEKRKITDQEIADCLPGMKKAVFSATADTHRAEDAVQDVAVRVLKNGVPKDVQNLPAYLQRASRNQLTDLNRDKNNKHVSLDVLPEGTHVPSLGQDYKDSTENVEEQSDTLVAALNGLDEESYHLIYLYYFEDMPMANIAEAFGLSTSSISRRLADLRDKLKQNLNNPKLF